MLNHFKRSVAIFATAMILAPAAMADINYGDFAGTSVMYLDVTESSVTDPLPLYNAPSIVGNQLDFDPTNFVASSSGGGADFTEGQLNFTVMGIGTAITSFTVFESGDYSLLGTGGVSTEVNYGVSIASVTVLEIDGIALGTPISLSAASLSGHDNLSLGTDSLTSWNRNIVYDLNAALTGEAIDFDFGATKIEFVINNQLSAISESSSIASIAKKDFNLNVTTVIVPAPGAMALLALAGLICGSRRRRA